MVDTGATLAQRPARVPALAHSLTGEVMRMLRLGKVQVVASPGADCSRAARGYVHRLGGPNALGGGCKPQDAGRLEVVMAEVSQGGRQVGEALEQHGKSVRCKS